MRGFILLCISLGCVFGSFSASSQNFRSRVPDERVADQNLNKTYQDVMRKLPPKSRTQLRDAQRAWLTFMVQDCAAAGAAAPKLGKKDDDLAEFKVGEFERRTDELVALVDRESSTIERWDDKAKQEHELSKSELEVFLRTLDPELNVVYERCLHLLPEQAAAPFRDAQRAWVAFKDATKPFGTYAVVQTTAFRIRQLSDFYVGYDETLNARNPEEQKLDPTVPDPFERAR
jgi:uncharacterized protein YecT (DUF1311 family)